MFDLIRGMGFLMKRKHLAVISAVVVALGMGVLVAGCGAYLGTTTTTQSNTQTSTPNQKSTTPPNGAPKQGQAAPGQRSGVRGGRVISGTVTASDASSVTVKTVSGGTQTVALSDSTKISVTSDGTPADLVPGKTVVAYLTTDSNNTQSASQVHVGVNLPQGMLGGRRQVPGGRGTFAVFGTISASDASSLTVQTPNGGTQKVPLTSSTKIVVTRDGTAADLTAGKNVVILATRGTDNKLMASQIQVGVNLAQHMPMATPQGRSVPRGFGDRRGGRMMPQAGS
jgi:hypothetical protein